ncbi:unnamed protein product [Moneuplotes crassus]|uniref:C2H2-type domain-containing protein n=1 Tax=Euplotes crassus TaxID=5936 RepID=A0AAD2DB28_EUPCR|nr:unnamed protein product [Moneuplotes crassus]
MSQFPEDPNKNIEIILKGFGMIGDLPSNHWTQAIKDTFSNHNLTGESQAGGTQRKNSSAFEYLMDLFDNTLHQKNKYLNDATRQCENSTHKEKRRTSKDYSFKQDRRKTELKERGCHKLSKRTKSLRPHIPLSKKLSEQKSNLQAQMKRPKIPSKDKEEAKTVKEKSSKSCARTQLIILDSWDKNLATTPTPILSQCLAQNSAKPQKSVELNDFSDGSLISVNNAKSFKYAKRIKKNAIKEFRLKLENRIKRARAKLFKQKKLKQIPCSLGKNRLALKNSLRKYPCCGETFSTKSLLLRHVTTHWNKNDPTKPYHCPFPKCTNTYSYNDSFREHYKSHTNHPLYKKGTNWSHPKATYDIWKIAQNYIDRVNEIQQKEKQGGPSLRSYEFIEVMKMKENCNLEW